MTPSVKKIIPKTLVKNFTDYSNETTIHGVKYLTNRTRPLLDRIFWIIIFILSTSCLGYLVYKIGRTWMDHEVMINDRTEPIHTFEIPFPAITICPQIKTKRDQIDFSQLPDVINQFANFSNFIKSDYGKKFLMASQVCRDCFDDSRTWPPINSNIKSFHEEYDSASLPTDWINILHDMSPNFNEVFEDCEMVTCFIRSNTLDYKNYFDCTELFSTIITNEGICFTFNTIDDILREDSLHTDFQYHDITQRRDGWDPEKGYNKDKAYPFKGFMKGPLLESAFTFDLDANLEDTTPECGPQDVGYKIILHSPSAYPYMYNNYFLLEYGTEYEIAVVPQTIETSDDLRSVTPEERRCFFNDERKLKFYTFYNEENCQLECYTNYSARIHHSVPFSSPRNSNTTNYRLKVLNEDWELLLKIASFNGHLQEYMKLYNISRVSRYINSGYKYEYVNCNCLPECNSIKYGYKIVKSHKTSIEKRTTISILFNEPTFIGQQRVRVYTFETMISDFGGLLGLFMGGSLLSFFEIIYFLTIRICFKPKEDTATN